MSVKTTADEKIERAQSLVTDAIADLSEVVITECWGHDQYNAQYRAQLGESLRLLLDVREKLRTY